MGWVGQRRVVFADFGPHGLFGCNESEGVDRCVGLGGWSGDGGSDSGCDVPEGECAWPAMEEAINVQET